MRTPHPGSASARDILPKFSPMFGNLNPCSLEFTNLNPPAEMPRTINVELSLEEHGLLSSVLEKLQRSGHRELREIALTEFLASKKHLFPYWEDIAVIAKAQGHYADKTVIADIARPLENLAIKSGLFKPAQKEFADISTTSSTA